MGNFTGFEKSEDYYQHPKLGLIKRIQKQNGPQLIQHKIIVESEEVVQEWKTYLQSLEHCGLREVLFLPHNYYFQRVGYCGRNGEVFLLFDDFMFSLKEEIEDRRKIQRLFPESTVIEILYRLAKAERDLEKLNLRIGHVNPDNIMVNEDGDWRIISEHSCPHSLFPSIEEEEELKEFSSPEEFLKESSEPHEGETKILRQSNISEIFSIGMMILEICTLEPSEQVYQNGFNHVLLKERIETVECKYSFGLTNIVKGMLELDANKRMKSTDIVKILEPYEKHILSHKQITFEFHPISNVKSNTNIEIINNSTKTTLNNILKLNKNTNKLERLINFFPFLHQEIKNNKEMNHKTFHKTGSCFGERRTITVGGSH